MRLFNGRAGFPLSVFDVHREQVRTGVEKLTGEHRGILGHQVHVKGNRGVRADGADEIGEEEQARHEVTVGRIQMEGIGPGREAAYRRFKVGEIRGPERDVSQQAVAGQLRPGAHVSG